MHLCEGAIVSLRSGISYRCSQRLGEVVGSQGIGKARRLKAVVALEGIETCKPMASRDATVIEVSKQ